RLLFLCKSTGHSCLCLSVDGKVLDLILFAFRCEYKLFIVNVLLDEEEGVANDSDSSPPQSRGRGRFEKSRAKMASRGQSEETRSTSSSQAADEESSSHVNALSGIHFNRLFWCA
ncbi:hypothetical protein XENOCAPTIV_002088, partial [Xenoophorus captivus]